MDQPEGLDELFVGSVTVGERGQVVIPAHARENMSLQPGDKLLAFIHPQGQMICLCKLTVLEKVAASLSRLQSLERTEADDDEAEQE